MQEREEEANWLSLVLFQVYTVIVSINVLDVKIENLRHLFDLLIEANKKSLRKRKDSYLQIFTKVWMVIIVTLEQW